MLLAKCCLHLLHLPITGTTDMSGSGAGPDGGSFVPRERVFGAPPIRTGFFMIGTCWFASLSCSDGGLWEKIGRIEREVSKKD